MNVPMFQFEGWACDFQPRKGHVFTLGRQRVLVRKGAFDGQLVVQRSWADRTFNLAPAIYGSRDGGEQGGQGIVLQPSWDMGTRAAMDGVMMRHPVGIFDADGRPTLGDGKRYPLAATPLPNGYQKIDGSHLIRAYSHAVAQFSYDRDPVARMWLILVAYDVMRRFPMQPFVNGEGPEYSLATMHRNVFAAPHLAKLGIVRENAWCLRAVVEAQRVAPSREFAEWIRTFVEMCYMGQAENGSFADTRYGEGLDQEEPVAMFGVDPRFGWCAVWQQAFLVRALNEARKLLPGVTDKVRVMFARYASMWDTVPQVKDDYSDTFGLPRYVIVSENGMLFREVTWGVGPARTEWQWDTMRCFEEMGVSV